MMKGMVGWFGYFVLFGGLVILAFAWSFLYGQEQSKRSLFEISKSIDKTESQIKQAKTKKWNLLQQIEWLKSKQIYRQEFLSEMKRTMESQQSRIKASETKIEHQKIHIAKLQQQYVHLLKLKLIHRVTFNPLLTLAHQENLDKQSRRWYSIQYLESNIKSSFKQLDSANASMVVNMRILQQQYHSQDSILKASQEEQACLQMEIKEYSALVASMDALESGLKEELKRYKIRKENLSSIISEAIKEKSKLKATTRRMSTKLLLDFPVQFPTVVSRFGKNIDSGNPNLMIRNNGIDIQSNSPFVKSACDAKVVQIRKLPSNDYLVILKADDYYLAYSNLESVLLREGDAVALNTTIGKLLPNEIHSFELHFEVWKGNQPIDPMKFLN